MSTGEPCATHRLTDLPASPFRRQALFVIPAAGLKMADNRPICVFSPRASFSASRHAP